MLQISEYTFICVAGRKHQAQTAISTPYEDYYETIGEISAGKAAISGNHHQDLIVNFEPTYLSFDQGQTFVVGTAVWRKRLIWLRANQMLQICA